MVELSRFCPIVYISNIFHSRHQKTTPSPLPRQSYNDVDMPNYRYKSPIYNNLCKCKCSYKKRS